MSGEDITPSHEAGDQLMGDGGTDMAPRTSDQTQDELASAVERHQQDIVAARQASRSQQGENAAEAIARFRQNVVGRLARLGKFFVAVHHPEQETPDEPTDPAPRADAGSTGREQHAAAPNMMMAGHHPLPHLIAIIHHHRASVTVVRPDADSAESRYHLGVKTIENRRYNTDTQEYEDGGQK
jgi:hypothetical protein